MTLLMTVERYLRVTAMTPSRFGREVAGDPRLVFDLRKGREPRPHMAARMTAFIALQPAGPAPARPRPASASNRKKTVNSVITLLGEREAA